MKKTLKKFVPTFFWEAARRGVIAVSGALDRIGPQVRNTGYSGFRLFYNRGNSIIERLRREPIFEPDLCASIEEELKKKDAPVFLDIGANLGLISLYLLAKVPDLKVFAFEPGPAQAELLERTVRSNGLRSRLILAKTALSDTAGLQTFYVHPKRDMSKDGLRDTQRGEKTVKIEVEVVTLDSWWKKAGSPRIDVVKLDTEGSELLVLRGAKEFLTTVRPVLYLEIEPLNLKAYPYGAPDIYRYITSLGYALSTLDGVTVIESNLEKCLADGHDSFAARYAKS